MGNLNQLFFLPEQYRRTEELSIAFLFDENRGFASVGRGLESAFKTAKQKQVGAIMTTSATSFFAERKRIVELAVKYRLPAIYYQNEFVDEGGLMFYGADIHDLYRKAVHYVDRIPKGTKPSDLPVLQATKFEFIISLKAAKQIGLTLSPAFLSRANKVIQ